MSPSAIREKTGGKRICCRFRSVNAHVEQERPDSAELETVRVSRSPTNSVTANGEVQTQEEATVYVKELDIFLTMKVLENTPAVLSLAKLCDENGYSYEWINGQKPHLSKNGMRIQSHTENFVPIVVPGLSASSSSGSDQSTSRSDSVCQRIGFFFRDSKACRRYTCRSLTRLTLRRSRIFPVSGPVVRTHNS